MPLTSVLCVFCAYIVRCSCCLHFSGQHTASQRVFPSRVARSRRCAYSMAPEQHKPRKIQAQNLQTLLND